MHDTDIEDTEEQEQEVERKELKPKEKTKEKKEEKKPKPKPNFYVEINRFHRLLGHASEESMRRTAKHYNVQLTGKFEACEDCQKSNVAQRNVKKTTDDVSTRFGERLCIDSSSVVEHQSLGGGKVWLCVVELRQ